MTTAPLQSKYETVTARFVSLQGEPKVLSFARDASLHDMQKDLCSAYGKYYPFIEAHFSSFRFLLRIPYEIV